MNHLFNKYFVIILFITLFSCKTNSKSIQRYPTWLSKTELKQRNLINYRNFYKPHATRLMSYLYKNDKSKFNQIKGDFYNIKFGENSAYNFMVGYWEDYGAYKTSLIVLIRNSDSSLESIKTKEIKITSKNFGDLIDAPFKHNTFMIKYPQKLFVRKIDLVSKHDILKMIRNDEINILIDNEKYKFVIPE